MTKKTIKLNKATYGMNRSPLSIMFVVLSLSTASMYGMQDNNASHTPSSIQEKAKDFILREQMLKQAASQRRPLLPPEEIDRLSLSWEGFNELTSNNELWSSLAPWQRDLIMARSRERMLNTAHWRGDGGK